ncbi:hypothetical protein [Candidatus Viadribacter manganicus]|uniref:STAS/SEC14 domain-containing protein n=1 Tax=Candidatus Viadribacter manganicus TaxID=1759059 RepID=A0A1B1AH56_9PROT|nr:hypothetical protein [Candidatus Viadribacter manganicus]ANP45871.1 hypothetical protein ATE48_08025 [Candidatus Viadribacter manganicus]
MAISIYLNDDRCLRIVHFETAITTDELEQLVALYSQRSDWLSYDTFYLLDAASVNRELHADHLEQLRRRTAAIYADIASIVVRRSAWICQNAEMRSVAEQWVTMRRLTEGASVKFVVGDKFEDALPLFTEAELAAVKTKADFALLARIG